MTAPATTTGLTPTGPTPAATATAGTRKALYVYGITPAGVWAPRSPGVDGARVRLLTDSGLSAAVSSAPVRLRPRRRDLMARTRRYWTNWPARGPSCPCASPSSAPGPTRCSPSSGRTPRT
ncbi:GvpL/GvpF family gas vesicle protein [Streptomyces mutabilis]|uniref:GvpL/GvpF family gas vesicle protein n=1 Tax=Streptomyces mutabilis TaxID=67332 RepID=UPI0022BA51C3|nr:GvpL/GvpF family gas vesicle protein [Streptomyces mutabilis]MCZ9351902.1 GvpL/GvpF family gas vesicle protein [Streptomyces mutabilis]